jgi:aldehyde:ferredoxin oxidoreductase
LFGYAGKILNVELTRGKISASPLSRELAEKFIGGVGIASRILYDTVPPWVGAFDPLNQLIFTTGVMTGTRVPCVGRYFVAAKSPLTGYFGDSNAGGFWGAELKFAGYDAIVLSGKAPKPVYLWINDGEVRIEDATAYWGMNTREADRAIRKDLGDRNIKVADIGDAGENLVRFASIMSEDAGRAAGRCGMGAVMGFKNLKAIAVRGHNSIPVADDEALKKKATELIKMLKEDDKTTGYTAKYGTSGYYSSCVELGDSPVRNWTKGYFEDEEKISGAPGGGCQEILTGRRACIYCPIGCRRVVTVKDGPYATEPNVEGLEYESLAALGGDCFVSDIKAIAKANDLCNLHGLDTISTGATVAFAMECFENGIITKEDTEGIDLRFGNAEALVMLVDKIARREGVGRVLGEGTRRAAHVLSGAEGYAIHVKGLEVAMHDPRAFPAMCTTYAASPVGADHMEGETTFVEGLLHVPYPLLELDGLDRLTAKRKAEAGFKVQNLWHVIGNCMGYCLIACATGATVYPLEYNLLFFGLVTGRKMPFREAMRIGERVFNLKKAFNVRHGATRAEDTLPERFLKESHVEGGSKGQVALLDEILPEYYELRGWDLKTGKPTKGKLEELELFDVARDLWE